VPFTVQELYDTLVPYRHYRRDLGIETNQDYEAALTRLLSGENGYIRADQAMQDRLKKELASPPTPCRNSVSQSRHRMQVVIRSAAPAGPGTARELPPRKRLRRSKCRGYRRWRRPLDANSAEALCRKAVRRSTVHIADRTSRRSTARAAALSWIPFGNSASTAGRKLRSLH
jgi:hypothetical protein